MPDHAETGRHDEGVLCTALDGHHRLERGWGWYCAVCGARLRLGVWYSADDYVPLQIDGEDHA